RSGGCADRDRLGQDRYLDQQRDDVGLLADQTNDARGISTRDRSDLPWLRLRDTRGVETDVAAGSRHDRASWKRAGLSRYSAAKRLLRSQARRPGFLRFAVVRTTPRQQQRESHDGANARAQHAAIRLGQKPFTPQSAAGAADFPAGG